jgi:hypothetical protein
MQITKSSSNPHCPVPVSSVQGPRSTLGKLMHGLVSGPQLCRARGPWEVCPSIHSRHGHIHASCHPGSDEASRQGSLNMATSHKVAEHLAETGASTLFLSKTEMPGSEAVSPRSAVSVKNRGGTCPAARLPAEGTPALWQQF